MRRRLYYMLPNVTAAREVMNDLLLARIEARHMHVLARRGTDLQDLPEANFLQKTDAVHAAEVGGAIGGLIGAVAGIAAMLFFLDTVQLPLVTILIAALVGVAFGIWAASLAGAAVPNTRLKAFQSGIEAGRILMMVDVPWHRLSEINELVLRRHPDAMSGGVEPTIPAFP
ncbi:MAG TPA: DUF1269 domain-containing protein [Burkholderiales bacterium]|nr:DUF1269 domain-containing protein [Burkholderiales bacterium]